MKAEAEIARMQPHAKECLGPLEEGGRILRWSLPREFGLANPLI